MLSIFHRVYNSIFEETLRFSKLRQFGYLPQDKGMRAITTDIINFRVAKQIIKTYTYTLFTLLIFIRGNKSNSEIKLF